MFVCMFAGKKCSFKGQLDDIFKTTTEVMKGPKRFEKPSLHYSDF